MEELLDCMDGRDYHNDQRLIQQRQHDVRSCPATEFEGLTRTQLLDKLEDAITKYDQLLLNTQHLAAMNRPTEREYRSVARFVKHRAPLVSGEADYIYHKLDVVTLRPGRETAWLDHAVLSMVRRLPKRVTNFLYRKNVRSIIGRRYM
jgi:hypothetical protein